MEFRLGSTLYERRFMGGGAAAGEDGIVGEPSHPETAVHWNESRYSAATTSKGMAGSVPSGMRRWPPGLFAFPLASVPGAKA